MRVGTLRVLPLGGAVSSFTLCLWGLGQCESGALRAVCLTEGLCQD